MSISSAIGDMKFMNGLFSAADQIAAEMGADMPGVEHLVLAALCQDDNSARLALAACHADADDLRTAVTQVHDEALESLGIEGVPAPTASTVGRIHRSTGAAQDVFARAVALSKESKPSRLRTAHVLLAAAEREQGTFPRALAAMGVNRDDLATAAREALA